MDLHDEDDGYTTDPSGDLLRIGEVAYPRLRPETKVTPLLRVCCGFVLATYWSSVFVVFLYLLAFAMIGGYLSVNRFAGQAFFWLVLAAWLGGFGFGAMAGTLRRPSFVLALLSGFAISTLIVGRFYRSAGPYALFGLIYLALAVAAVLYVKLVQSKSASTAESL